MRHHPPTITSGILVLCAGTAVFLAAVGAPSAPAQDPAPARSQQRGAPLVLVEAGALLGARIHRSEPLAGGGGAAAAEASSSGSRQSAPVAVLRDAVLTPYGVITSYLVEPLDQVERSGRSQLQPSADPAPAAATQGAGAELRVLPADRVRWDDPAGHLATELTAAEVAALPRHEAAGSGEPGSAEPGPPSAGDRDAADPALLLTQLRRAGVRYADADPAAPGEAPHSLWLAPAVRRLAFAEVLTDAGAHLVPWSLFAPAHQGEQLVLQVAVARDAIEAAPSLPDSIEAPTRAQREAAYEHFRLPVPGWVDAAEAAARRGSEAGDGGR